MRLISAPSSCRTNITSARAVNIAEGGFGRRPPVERLDVT